jgi:hypothetical protein
MKRQQAITIGPFFAKAFSDVISFGPVQLLNLVLEWATPERAISIPLFRGGGPHDQNQLRLHHILLRRENLPCDLQCPAYQVVTSDTDEFLPLDALLAALFQGDQIRRPVFSILKELSSVIPPTAAS